MSLADEMRDALEPEFPWSRHALELIRGWADQVERLEAVATRAAIAYYELFDDDEFPKASLHRGKHGHIMWQSAVCQLLSDLRESALSTTQAPEAEGT